MPEPAVTREYAGALHKCVGCGQAIVVTHLHTKCYLDEDRVWRARPNTAGITECGGEGEGVCCVYVADDEACRDNGHEPHRPAVVRGVRHQHGEVSETAVRVLAGVRTMLDQHDTSDDDEMRADLRDGLQALADYWPGTIRDEIEAAGHPVR